MVLLTLGIPPGFDVLTEDLDKAVKVDKDAGPATRQPSVEKLLTTISSYEVTGRQLLIYLDALPEGSEFKLGYRLRAKYPVKAQTGSSEARYYYQAHKRGTAKSRVLEVR